MFQKDEAFEVRDTSEERQGRAGGVRGACRGVQGGKSRSALSSGSVSNPDTYIVKHKILGNFWIKSWFLPQCEIYEFFLLIFQENWGGATFDVAMRFLHECPVLH